MILSLKLDTITEHEGRQVAYVQIVSDADAVEFAFSTYYAPDDQAGFKAYCDGQLAAEQARVDALDAARTEINGLFQGGN